MALENKVVLSEEAIQTEVEALEGWEYLSGSKVLRRVWQFDKFVPTMAFVRRLTEIMDENNHHSDLNLDSRNKPLTVTVTPHSENAVTQADVDFARALNNG